ncbi:MAG: thymidine phosphorylase [Clostridiales bacterium]|nr:thymidine phosphorylase [Clostridiales bacterium]
MRMYDIISKKRDKQELTKEEISYFIKNLVSGEIPDYQTSALLMAICINGMSDRETLDLTIEMEHSGDCVDLSSLKNTVDKHSTGGVGDKTSLIIVPIAAACGGTVAKMSGRGLGHTGGTIDKLESIPGFKTELSPDVFMKLSKENGLALVGQSGNMAPADKKLYAIRDVTATVSCMPLIVSSIMSKKLAAGAQNIVLDVTVGSGAFIPDINDARVLAQTMVNVGKGAGRNVAAVLTDMDEPLGYSIGNNLEVIEAVDVLKNKGPEDLTFVALTLASEMVSLFSGKPSEECFEECKKVIQNGKALEKFRQMVIAQGGDVSYIDDTTKFKKADYSCEIKAAQSGYISKINTEAIGVSSVMLGAGREKKSDSIDFSAGIRMVKKLGDKVSPQDTIAVLYTSDESRIKDAKAKFESAISYADSYSGERKLVYGVIR